MSTSLVAFFVSLALTGWIVRLNSRGRRIALDVDFSGPQKFHSRPVPRVGGIGILVGLAAAIGSMRWFDGGAVWIATVLLLCAIPAFGAGLVEDMTRKVSPKARLIATAVSAGLCCATLGAQIVRTDIPGLDAVVATAAGAWVVTIFAVAGLANSVNIIDGFNGLASMCVVIMLLALAFVSFQVGDPHLGTITVACAASVIGFFVWNFPAGLIFLGDGGAYFLGFMVAELSILLLVRNEAVSPMFPLLVCIYPIFETLFSIYRRRFLRALPPSMPDGIHLHSLIFRRVLRWAVGDRSAKALTRRNSMTSPYLWLLSTFSAVPAVLFWDNTAALWIFLLLFVVTYVYLYWRIVRFKAPRWLRQPQGRARTWAKQDNRGS